MKGSTIVWIFLIIATGVFAGSIQLIKKYKNEWLKGKDDKFDRLSMISVGASAGLLLGLIMHGMFCEGNVNVNEN
jgi:hypothetical protein